MMAAVGKRILIFDGLKSEQCEIFKSARRSSGRLVEEHRTWRPGLDMKIYQRCHSRRVLLVVPTGQSRYRRSVGDRDGTNSPCGLLAEQLTGGSHTNL